MTEKVTYNIKLKGSDGKEYSITPEQLAQWLGICKLKNRLGTLEQPLRQQKILDLLKSEGPRSSSYLHRHLRDYRWTDMWDLISVKKKVVLKHHGTQGMFHLYYPARDDP